MSTIKRILLFFVMLNLLTAEEIKQEDWEEFIKVHSDEVKALYTPFGCPGTIILTTEESKKDWEEFLCSKGYKRPEMPTPTKRMPEKVRECFSKYSREASPEDLALVDEYGVKDLRIIDCDSIVAGLDEGIKQEFFRIKAIAEAYISAQVAICKGTGSKEELEKAKATLLGYLDFWWFERLHMDRSCCLCVYTCGRFVNGGKHEFEYLSLEDSFPCLMDSETLENFKQELRKTIFDLITSSLVCDYPPYYNAELLILSLVVLEDTNFTADYIYYACNLVGRFNLMLDQKPYRISVDSDKFKAITEDMPSRRQDILYRFLIFSLYKHLGIMWDYSLVGDLNSPLEKGLFGLLKEPSGSTEHIQIPHDVCRFWFCSDKTTSEPIEMEPQRFYNLVQIAILHGGPENIWAGIGFADIDGRVYVNRTIVGKLGKFGIPPPEIHNVAGLLKSVGHWPIFSKDIYDFIVRATPPLFWEIADKFDKCQFETKPWRRPPVLVAGELLPPPITESLRAICRPWSVWLQLLNGYKRPQNYQREVKLLRPFMDKYLMFYTEQ